MTLTEPVDWSSAEAAALDALGCPADVQALLDATPYSTDPVYRCPRSVLRDRRAHCFDGAVLAAAAFRHLGLPPRIVDLRAWRDDDHVITVFQRDKAWGAVAKSNVVGLRWREPVYRSLRELVMSYFDEYYNLEKLRALRAYSAPLDLSRYDRHAWCTDDACMERIAAQLDRMRHTDLLSAAQVAALQPVDGRRFAAGLLGTEDAGLYKPWEHQDAGLV
ncbi:MAG: transglutaminase domain-containing protein [Pseudomonadota bacterium]